MAHLAKYLAREIVSLFELDEIISNINSLEELDKIQALIKTRKIELRHAKLLGTGVKKYNDNRINFLSTDLVADQLSYIYALCETGVFYKITYDPVMLEFIITQYINYPAHNFIYRSRDVFFRRDEFSYYAFHGLQSIMIYGYYF